MLMQSLKKSAKKNKFKKFMTSNKIKLKFESIRDKLKNEVESLVKEFEGKMEKILSRTSTVILVADANRFPLPKALVDVSAEPNGKHLKVKLRDSDNIRDTLRGYHIYIDDRDPPWFHSVGSDDIDGNDEINIQDSDILIGWKQNNIQVCTVNLAGLEGPLSARIHIPVVMNQHPPTVEHMGVKLNATSKSTIMLSFDYPKGYNKMGIDMCHVTGRVEYESYTNKVKIHKPGWDRGFIVLENVDPTKPYCEIYLSFANRYGSGKQCKKPEKFVIEDLMPSAPILEVESSTIKVV